MTSFRQLEQRHVSAEIALMEWNPTMDLIALATLSGEVLLHRLSWQKVWTIAAQGTKEHVVAVTALAWRPDGKILAYAYDNGKVTLCDVENSDTVHVSENMLCVVTSLNWVQCLEKDDLEVKPFFTERGAEFLPKQSAFVKAYGASLKQIEEVAEDFKKMKGQKQLNILAIGMDGGIVHLHSFGLFPTGYFKVKANSEGLSHDRILTVTLSRDFRMLTFLVESKKIDDTYNYYYQSYHVSLLYDYMDEIKVVSLKYGHISSLLTYMSTTLRAISEAWEDILLEVDTKLHNYAQQKDSLLEGGSISDDFLELLMFGNPSDALEKFLLHDLTESGLKKFGHSIEQSYSNIQKLVLKRLQNVATSLFYHLNDFRGMAMWNERFGALGLDESAVKDAVMIVGSFLLKATELQQVIDNSMKNFKAFFRWLYSVILRLSDEPIPLEISRLSEQELSFVADFLKENFNVEYNKDKKKTVKLERVAQYLKKEDLAHPANTSGNPWMKFLDDNASFRDSGVVFKHYKDKSLVTLYADVRKMIDTAVKGPWGVLKNSVRLRSCYLLDGSAKVRSPPRISHVWCSETRSMYTVITNQAPPSPHFFLIRERPSEDDIIEAVGVQFNSFKIPGVSKDTMKVLDLKFYSNDVVTILLQEEDHVPVLLQLPIKSLVLELRPVSGQVLGENIPMVDVSSLLAEKCIYKKLDMTKATQIAVSGSRKVVCVLFTSRRQVRLFEMDIDEEEEEEETDDSALMKDVSKLSVFSDDEIKPE